ncbi:hypothetical protein [Thermus filiformis]|uniref:Uncharacterized protein n=1 Tax=Thermus filiformis TaxID=276 RepID=A0A0D6X9W1_THEFI|nr:hypothetical protein [Thermus filiformis]KIX84709.1 hypothetical protein THFILI_03845 [Thermus filiformis]
MRSVEESPESFFVRFMDWAIEAHLYPAPWGSPLLLARTEAGFVYALDRGAPPAPAGRVRALFHGLVQEVWPYRKTFLRREGPRYRAAGRVRPLGEGFYVVEAGLPLLVHSENPLPDEAELLLHPPLMLFREP